METIHEPISLLIPHESVSSFLMRLLRGDIQPSDRQSLKDLLSSKSLQLFLCFDELFVLYNLVIDTLFDQWADLHIRHHPEKEQDATFPYCIINFELIWRILGWDFHVSELWNVHRDNLGDLINGMLLQEIRTLWLRNQAEGDACVDGEGKEGVIDAWDNSTQCDEFEKFVDWNSCQEEEHGSVDAHDEDTDAVAYLDDSTNMLREILPSCFRTFRISTYWITLVVSILGWLSLVVLSGIEWLARLSSLSVQIFQHLAYASSVIIGRLFEAWEALRRWITQEYQALFAQDLTTEPSLTSTGQTLKTSNTTFTGFNGAPPSSNSTSTTSTKSSYGTFTGLAYLVCPILEMRTVLPSTQIGSNEHTVQSVNESLRISTVALILEAPASPLRAEAEAILSIEPPRGTSTEDSTGEASPISTETILSAGLIGNSFARAPTEAIPSIDGPTATSIIETPAKNLQNSQTMPRSLSPYTDSQTDQIPYLDIILSILPRAVLAYLVWIFSKSIRGHRQGPLDDLENRSSSPDIRGTVQPLDADDSDSKDWETVPSVDIYDSEGFLAESSPAASTDNVTEPGIPGKGPHTSSIDITTASFLPKEVVTYSPQEPDIPFKCNAHASPQTLSLSPTITAEQAAPTRDSRPSSGDHTTESVIPAEASTSSKDTPQKIDFRLEDVPSSSRPIPGLIPISGDSCTPLAASTEAVIPSSTFDISTASLADWFNAVSPSPDEQPLPASVASTPRLSIDSVLAKGDAHLKQWGKEDSTIYSSPTGLPLTVSRASTPQPSIDNILAKGDTHLDQWRKEDQTATTTTPQLERSDKGYGEGEAGNGEEVKNEGVQGSPVKNLVRNWEGWRRQNERPPDQWY